MSVITASIPAVATIRQFPYRRPRWRTLAAAVVLVGTGFTLLHAADAVFWQAPLAAFCFLAAAVVAGGLVVDAIARPVLGFEGTTLVLPAAPGAPSKRIEPSEVLRVDSFQTGRHALIRLHTRTGRHSISSLRLSDEGVRALYAWIDRHLSR